MFAFRTFCLNRYFLVVLKGLRFPFASASKTENSDLDRTIVCLNLIEQTQSAIMKTKYFCAVLQAGVALLRDRS